MIKKIIKNEWRREPGKCYKTSRILDHDKCPEGLDVERIKFHSNGLFTLKAVGGCILSVLKGSGYLTVSQDSGQQRYKIEEGTHCYLPPGYSFEIEAIFNTELICVSSPAASQARGEKFLLRNERFLRACASDSHSLRWTLTPQYLSRRIFLHHDHVLLSKAMHPVSWFHTTMFDVDGLPENQDGLPVFKMSYNSRTEFNCCYNVRGTARVRMATHPYSNDCQSWDPWLDLDGESTYLLNESDGCPEEEFFFDSDSGIKQTFRNKHEVFIKDGHVSLFCMMDPSPTGIERHRTGEYSDYPPLSQIVGTPEYATHQLEISKYDEMLDLLSLAQAMGTLDEFYHTPIWNRYIRGRDAQHAIESELQSKVTSEGKGREQIIAQWLSPASRVGNGHDINPLKEHQHEIPAAPAAV